MTFWEHLDQLRGVLIRIVCVTLLSAVVAFLLKEQLFALILAPHSDSFVAYRVFDYLSSLVGEPGVEHFNVRLINTALADQFMIHVKVALCVGFILSSPYIIYSIFKFVSPGLYPNERRYVVQMTLWGYLLFIVGMMVSYFLIFPLTFRFLGLYQVDPSVPNLITLQSYISTLMLLCLVMGIMFEIPAMMWILGRFGLVKRSYLRRYRRHAIVIIVVLAAIITPTGDIVTLAAVSLPIWLLFEAGILLVRKENS